jgi:membrane protease YdiL (CAAX protease family)
LPIAVPVAIAVKWRPFQPFTIQQKIPLVLSLYLLAPFLLWGVAHIQQVSFSSYGLPGQLSVLGTLIIGLCLGVMGVSLLFGLECWLGWATWQREYQKQLLPNLLPTLIIGLLVSGIEELVFRGFLQNQLQSIYLPWLAAAIASTIFALLHLVWDGGESMPQLPGLWLMGMVLVLARWVDSGSLGLACGLHAGWIWAIASLDSAQVIRYTGQGPEWVTGFSQQPLAGAMGLFLLMATAGAIVVLF